MSKIRIYGDTSGYIDVSAPSVSGNINLELPSNSTTTTVVGGNGSIIEIIKLTQSEYDAITPNSTTLYVIVG